LKPTFTYSLFGLAASYIKLGRPEEAIAPLQKLLEIQPRDALAHHQLGLVYVQTGNKTAAMEQYYLLQEINPAHAAQLLSAIPK